MRYEGDLVIAAGFATATGPRADNQDFGGVDLGSALERVRHGVLAAVADGVGGGKGGRAAAELAVRALIEGFYAMPDTLGPARRDAAAARRLQPLAAQHGRAARRWPTRATTFTALVLRGRRAHLRPCRRQPRLALFAAAGCACLTDDHVRPEPDMRHVLYPRGRHRARAAARPRRPSSWPSTTGCC